MYKPRIIPVLLLQNSGLVKSVKFKNHRYIGDPINAVKIFNDLEADELVFLDIDATKQNRTISLELVKNIGEEANMPFAVGGGIQTLKQIEAILHTGAEKIILNSIAFTNPNFVKQATDEFGSSTICVCIDVKKNMFGKPKISYQNATKNSNTTLEDFVSLMEEMGAGEIIIQSVDNDGMQSGYDIALIDSVSKIATIPIVALGGAKNYETMNALMQKTIVNGLAAGSMFIYHGNRNGILINYPTEKDKKTILHI